MRITIDLGPAEIASGQALFAALQALAGEEMKSWNTAPVWAAPATATANEPAAGIIPEIAKALVEEAEAETAAKRTRRTKAQIEVDKALEELKAKTEAVLAAPETQAAPVAPETTPAPAPTTKVGIEKIMEFAVKMTTDKPDTRPKLWALRDNAPFKVKTIRELKPEQYDAFWAKLQEIASGAVAVPAETEFSL